MATAERMRELRARKRDTGTCLWCPNLADGGKLCRRCAADNLAQYHARMSCGKRTDYHKEPKRSAR